MRTRRNLRPVIRGKCLLRPRLQQEGFVAFFNKDVDPRGSVDAGVPKGRRPFGSSLQWAESLFLRKEFWA